MKLSILTATYNRAKHLPKLYESIKKNLNTKLDIEWIIIDDGSTDETNLQVQSWIKESKIQIKYQYQQNSGKMVAINKAINIAEGDLIVDCDSDDYFTENAFNKIEQNVAKLLENSNLYAIVFLKKETNGNLSGNKFKQNEQITTMFDLYFKQDIQGEKILVFNSKIRKKYTHEIENKEKFITESRMYHKIDEKYKILTINEVIQQGSYIEDGYTKNIQQTFKKYPYGYYMYFKEILSKDMKGVLWKKRIYVIKHYILFGYLTKNKFNDTVIKNKINKILYKILYLPGIIKSKKF